MIILSKHFARVYAIYYYMDWETCVCGINRYGRSRDLIAATLWIQIKNSFVMSCFILTNETRYLIKSTFFFFTYYKHWMVKLVFIKHNIANFQSEIHKIGTNLLLDWSPINTIESIMENKAFMGFLEIGLKLLLKKTVILGCT